MAIPRSSHFGGEQAFRKAQKKIYDFDLFENNEAFALSNVLFNRKLGVPYEKLNVYGGAIALGYPIGASGARILVTLLNALQQQTRAVWISSSLSWYWWRYSDRTGETQIA